MKTRVKISLIVFIFTLLLGALFSTFLVLDYFKQPGPLDRQLRVVIESGSSLSNIGSILEQNKVIRHPKLFIANIHLRGRGGDLKAGEYRFPPFVTPKEIFRILVSGHTVRRRFTIPEGLTTHEVMDLLNCKKSLKNPVTITVQEGELLPETYFYSFHDDRNKLLERMREKMTQIVEEAWHKRDKNLPLTSPRDAVILASIVEKETAIPGERAKIAAVFMNRLRKGMPLQSDPTVIYGLWKETGIRKQLLSREELGKPTSYNTYVNKGLPPSPICNPGKDSIEAVLNPAKTDDLFFVADGTGGHVFASTYTGHQRNHHQWRKIRAQRLKEQQNWISSTDTKDDEIE
jgi:UPF0755 protein